MEPKTIQKNRDSLKSRMSKDNFFKSKLTITTKVLFATILAIVIMDLDLGNIASGNGIFVYCNTDCDISGELNNNGIIDIHLKKRWNKVFEIYCSSSPKIITLGTNNVVFSPKAG